MRHVYGSAADPQKPPIKSVGPDGIPIYDMGFMQHVFVAKDYGSRCQCGGRHVDNGRDDGECDNAPEFQISVRRQGDYTSGVAELLCGDCGREMRAIYRPDVFKVNWLEAAD